MAIQLGIVALRIEYVQYHEVQVLVLIYCNKLSNILLGMILS